MAFEPKSARHQGVRPGDHPDFFRFPAPPGQSRESRIVLSRNGEFWSDGEKIKRPSMTLAFFRWIRRHPDDGRYILSNGYDWTYFTVEDVPFFVVNAKVSSTEILLTLSDGSEETLRLSTVRIGPGDALYCQVKRGDFEARFQPHAQLALADALVEEPSGRLLLRVGDEELDVSRPDLSACR